MYYINDPKNYKKCKKKRYNVWLCMPPLGTCVLNKLEHARFAEYITKRTWYLSGEMKYMKDSPLREAYAFLVKNAYITNEKNRFVISGTQGELKVIDSNTLAKTYVFLGNSVDNDEEISLKSVRARCMYSGDRMDWQLLEAKVDESDYFACHVPANKMFTLRTSGGGLLVGNDPIISHGKGDFVVCTANPDNTPNLNNRWIVNGLVFGDTYDNKGWSDKLINSMEGFKYIEKPKFSLMRTNVDPTYIDYSKVYEDEEDDTCYWINPVVLRKMNSSKKSAIEQIIQDKFKNKKLQVIKQKESSKDKESLKDVLKKQNSKEHIMYQMIARCVDGSKLVGYMLKTVDGSQVKILSKQEAYSLASKGQIESCIGRVSKDGVSLSGVGMRIRDLPIVDKNGNIVKTK